MAASKGNAHLASIDKGSKLIGASKMNEGLRIQLLAPQSAGGGRIEGKFRILSPGTGTCSNAIRTLMAQYPRNPELTASEALSKISSLTQADGRNGKKTSFAHIFNRNNLTISGTTPATE